MRNAIRQDRGRAIRIIITGGTFDKEYDELRGELTLRRTHLPEILGQVRCTLPVELEVNQLVDSLHMDEPGRERILEVVVSSPEEMIVITHGTDTMQHTARKLATACSTKTVVLTGAMVPYSVTGSDAVFNLGCAVAAVQLLVPGVYICMNGRVGRWDRLTKNRERGVFEEPLAAVDESTPG